MAVDCTLDERHREQQRTKQGQRAEDIHAEAKQHTTLLQAQTDLLLYAEDTPTAIPCLDVVAFAVGHRRKLCKQLSL